MCVEGWRTEWTRGGDDYTEAKGSFLKQTVVLLCVFVCGKT